MPPIQLLIKPASGTCDLGCTYCFYTDEMKKRDTANYGIMSIETLEILVQKTLAYAEKSCGFAFQGGEPTLVGMGFFENLLKFQTMYNIHNVEIHNSIQTNGYGLDEKWAEFFAKNHFLTGISLDGTKHTHNAYRVTAKGEPTFEKIRNAIALLEQFKVEYNILTVVHKKTAEKISKIYEFYAKNGWKYLQFIPCLDPLEETWGQQEYSLTPEIYGTFLNRLFELWYIDLKKGTQPYIRQFENYIGILMGYMPEACDQKGFCSIQFVVEADGSVYPCDFYVLEAYRIGSFSENSIEEMKKRGEEIQFVQKSLEQKKECEQCEYGFICRGGCRRNRQVGEDGQLLQNYFCSAYKSFFKLNLTKMREIARVLGKSFN